MELEHRKPPPFIRPKQHRIPPPFVRPLKSPSNIAIPPPLKPDSPKSSSKDISDIVREHKHSIIVNSKDDQRAVSFSSAQPFHPAQISENSNNENLQKTEDKKKPYKIEFNKLKVVQEEYDQPQVENDISKAEEAKLPFKIDLKNRRTIQQDYTPPPPVEKEAVKLEENKNSYKIDLNKRKIATPEPISSPKEEKTSEEAKIPYMIDLAKRRTQQEFKPAPQDEKEFRQNMKLHIRPDFDIDPPITNSVDSPISSIDMRSSFTSISRSSQVSSKPRTTILKTRPEEEIQEPAASTLEIDTFEFPDEDSLPPAPIRRPLIMSFPSFTKKTRKDNAKILTFSEISNIPIAMKAQANLVSVKVTDQLYSCPKLKKGVTAEQLDKMAKLLARHIFKTQYAQQSQNRKLVFN